VQQKVRCQSLNKSCGNCSALQLELIGYSKSCPYSCWLACMRHLQWMISSCVCFPKALTAASDESSREAASTNSKADQQKLVSGLCKQWPGVVRQPQQSTYKASQHSGGLCDAASLTHIGSTSSWFDRCENARLSDGLSTSRTKTVPPGFHLQYIPCLPVPH
jgi:hypothetical protein